MPIYEYKCKGCGKLFEIFGRFAEMGGEVNCSNCGNEKTERVFSIPHIEGEPVAGSGYGKTESPPTSLEPGKGMGGGLGRGPRDGR